MHKCSAYIWPVSDDLAFRALASPARRRVLRLVGDRPRSVGEVAAALDVSQPAASQHLAALREAGLVNVEVSGRRRIHRPDVDRLAELRSFFDPYWNAALDRLDAEAVGRAAERRVAS